VIGTGEGTDDTPVERHLTATGFVVWRGRTLLHWHRKNSLWLPFGGHIEPNEDPVQCMLREVEEESGIVCEVFGAALPFPFGTPAQLAAPVTILIEQVTDGHRRHEHIDLIYFCRPLEPPPAAFSDPTIRWLDAAALEANAPLAAAGDSGVAAVPEDVRVLALEAIRRSGGV
jgi:8-oxo-dGTP diphosphatase